MSVRLFHRTALSAALALALSSTAQASGIFFSEYIEGSSNNKALEIFNNTGSAIDLAAESFRVSMFFNGNTTAFTNIDLTGSVLDGETYVLAQSRADASILSKANQTNGNSWFNGDDAIVLYQGSNVLDSIGQRGFDPGSRWNEGGVSTQNSTLRRVSAPDTNPDDAFNPSLQWVQFANNTFDGLGCSGVDACASNTPSATELSIMQIQGSGHSSPHENEANIKTSGIVTQVVDNGFFIQDPQGDGDDRTSDGLFVFTGSAPTVSVGDGVNVTGTVDEFFGTTQIDELTDLSVESAGNRIDPLSIGTDAGAGHDRLIPIRLVDDAGSSSFDQANHGRDFYESLEGMLVKVSNVKAVGNTRAYGSDPDGDGIGNSDREVYAVADGGVGATNMNSRGGITITGDNSADNPIGADLNPERILINRTWADDLDHEIRQGDALQSEADGSIIGTVHYTFNDYIINATNTVSKDSSNSPLNEEVTSIAKADDRLTVGSYNMLNLDVNDNDGDADVANNRFTKLADHVVNHAGSPDVIGLQEIQDNSGSISDGTTSANKTLQALVDAIADAGGPAYQFIDNPFIGDNTNGGQPGGNIRNTFLYNPARVELKPGSLDAVTDPNDQQSNPGNPFFDSRLPLAATFIFNGEEVTVINNHFASKGGSDPLYGGAQPPVNGQVNQREAMAVAVNGFVELLLAADSRANVIALGDLNEFQFFSPLDLLANGGDGIPELTNLVTLLADASDAYSFNFEGNSQLLDHILVSANLMGLNPLFDIIHFNTGLMYAGLSGSAINNDLLAASDHDMLLASFLFRGDVKGGAVSVPATWMLLLGGLMLARARGKSAKA